MKKINKVLSVMLCIAMILTAFVGCGASNEEVSNTPAVVDDPVVLSYGLSTNMDHIMGVLAQEVKDGIEERTGGAVVIDIFPSGQLGTEADFIEGMMYGNIDMGQITTQGTEPFCSDLGILSIPYLWDSFEQQRQFWDSDMGLDIQGQLQEKGIYAPYLMSIGWRQWSNNVRPITCAEDMKGLIMRIMSSEITQATWEAMGVNCVVMPIGDVYSALQTGVIDGQDNAFANIKNNGFGEVQKYASETRHQNTLFMQGIGAHVKDKVTEEQWQIMMDVINEVSAKSETLYDEREAADIEVLESQGCTINYAETVDYDSFKAVLEPLYDEWAQSYGEWFTRVQNNDF